MKSLKVFFFGAICFALGCAQLSIARPTHVVPQVRMEIHADTSFTAHERELILKAAQQMNEQTNGFLEYRIVFDLNFDSIETLRKYSGKRNILTRVHSSAKDIEKKTLGYCIVNFNDLDLNNPARAALIYDRLPSDEAWIHVAMHEMLHMVRLQHIVDAKSIMYESTPVHNSLTCMTNSDMVELCTVHGCVLSVMKPC